MGRSDFEIRRIFSEEEVLPEVVRRKKHEAYDTIFDQVKAQETRKEENAQSEGATKRKGKMSLHRLGTLPKVAGFLIACVLVFGGTAVATTLLLNRYDRMKQMEQKEKDTLWGDLEQGGNLAYELSRQLTARESDRLNKLREKYKSNEAFPDGELARLAEGEAYSGEGVALCRGAGTNGTENLIYLPERELTDEELLEIVEYEEKLIYVVHENNEKRFAESAVWAKRLTELTDEEVDYYYLAFFSNRMDLFDGYCRVVNGVFLGSTEGGDKLSASENVRYQEMLREYEEKGRIPASEAVVIEHPEDYAGNGIAVCRYDANFYLPATELTDEELLQIIDFRKKAYYSAQRIDDDVKLGHRQARPSLPQKESDELKNLSSKKFSETAGETKLSELGDAAIGDLVEFGSYEQDGDCANGSEKIRWYVLDETQDCYVLLAERILDDKAFNEELKPVSWADSDLRGWLNGEFLKTAFSAGEQSRIVADEVRNEYGGDTKDRVYLLSDREICEYFGIDPQAVDLTVFGTDTKAVLKRQKELLNELDPRLFAKPTEEAKKRGAESFEQASVDAYLKFDKIDFSKALGNGSWWHRSASPQQGPFANATVSSGLVNAGQYVNDAYGIRPVIRVRK